MKHSTLTKKLSLYLIGFIIIIIAWEIYATTKNFELVFPKTKTILNSLFNLLKQAKTYSLILTSIIRIIISLIIALFISLLITFCYSMLHDSINLFRPLLTIFKSTPLVIISLFIYMAFSNDFGPIFVNILVSIPIITEGLINGINSIDKDITDQFKLEQANKLTKFIYLELPMNKNTLIMVILQTLGLSFKVIVMAEYLCQTNNSIGKTLESIKAAMEFNYLIAWGIIIVIIVTLLELLINKINKSLDN